MPLAEPGNVQPAAEQQLLPRRNHNSAEGELLGLIVIPAAYSLFFDGLANWLGGVRPPIKYIFHKPMKKQVFFSV